MALDIGTRHVGVAVSDELRVTTRAVDAIERKSWKKLLQDVKSALADFDAAALVIGLPYNFDGSESDMSADVRDVYRKFALSLDVPVFLQDERMSSYDARGRLWEQGYSKRETLRLKDSESAAIILGDFIDRMSQTPRP